MSTLHTLNASSRTHHALVSRLLCSASTGDAVLLIENGVYNLSDADFLQTLAQKNVSVYFLAIDAQARGLTINTALATPADDAQFVMLACEHSKVISWL
jgi:sulfur relay protein TusB/DsrH